MTKSQITQEIEKLGLPDNPDTQEMVSDYLDKNAGATNARFRSMEQKAERKGETKTVEHPADDTQ